MWRGKHSYGFYPLDFTLGQEKVVLSKIFQVVLLEFVKRNGRQGKVNIRQ